MRKPRAPRKPRFSVRLREISGCDPFRAIQEIDEYIRKYNCRGHSLRQAASDVLDGWAEKEELRPFFRQRLMVMVRHDDYEDQRAAGIGPEHEDRCGHRWTVDLTRRAIRCFWPDRLDSFDAVC